MYCQEAGWLESHQIFTYLDKQMQKSTKGTFLEYVLKNHIDLNQFDSFAALTATLSEKVGATLANMMKCACDFNII